jgi:hypothetical protein
MTAAESSNVFRKPYRTDAWQQGAASQLKRSHKWLSASFYGSKRGVSNSQNYLPKTAFETDADTFSRLGMT